MIHSGRHTIGHIVAAAFLLSTLALAGCGGGEEARPVTWHEDIAPLVTEKCSSCHEEEGIAPFSFESYENAKKYAGLMVEAVESGRMPPWLAEDTDECQPRLPWKDDLLTETLEIENGEVIIPNRPGWGGDLNEEVAREHVWERGRLPGYVPRA